MFVKSLLLLSPLLLSLSLTHASWRELWLPVHFIFCNDGEYFRQVKSYHDNGKEDRRWEIDCGKIASLGDVGNCHWSPYINTVEEMIAYNCPDDGVLSGWMSYVNTENNDRVFMVRTSLL